MRARMLPRERVLVAAGAILLALVLLGAIAWPRAALTGWLTGAIAFGAIPSGALLLVMMMRLIPGAWGEALRLSAEAATLLTPLAAAAMLPVLIGMAAIYPWVSERTLPAFQALWLAPIPFVVRTAVRFAAQAWFGVRMRRHRRQDVVAGAGVVAMPVLTSLVGVDWLMSLDPKFASSAFGLRVVLIETVIAFCALLLLRLACPRPVRRPGVLGALLLTLLLLSAYFLFLPFFVVWSSDLAANVGWYADRMDAGWLGVVWFYALVGGVPMVALLFAAVRQDPRWLAGLAVAVLVASAAELAWIALPGRGPLAIAGAALSLAGFAALAAGLLPAALRRRIRARSPGR